MSIDPRAGQPADPSQLADLPRLITAYYSLQPDASEKEQRVAFGTSGHRGSSLGCSFNEGHILAITQAICRYRKQEGITGPLFLGKDTHALSEPAFTTALEVLAANGVEVMIDRDGGYTPTPALSHAILVHNRHRKNGLADGIVITPSHNPPEDGGFKYNPPSGGPADTGATKWIENQANDLLRSGLKDVRRMPYARALNAETTHRHDFVSEYVSQLGETIDFDAIRAARLRLGVDPLGGAGIAYWPRIAEKYGLNLTVVHTEVDATFR
ncbi:MAG: phosphoglucomutase, alpha-D-glucose phosphate-specific, partial [Bryobacteraceae bacterium]